MVELVNDLQWPVKDIVNDCGNVNEDVSTHLKLYFFYCRYRVMRLLDDDYVTMRTICEVPRCRDHSEELINRFVTY